MEQSEQDTEFAYPNRVEVFETNVLHATDVIYWLDASSAETPEQMRRVDSLLSISLTDPPSDLSVLHSPGKTAIWRKPTVDIVSGRATEAQRTRSPMPSFTLTGEVRDHTGRYNPQALDLTVGTGDGLSVLLFPSVAATRVPNGGAVYGSLLIAGSLEPVIWAVLQLVVSLPGGDVQTVRAQSDHKGDFLLALTRLPPLPAGVTEYSAELTVSANLANQPQVAPNLQTHGSQSLESLTTPGSFSATLPVTVRPGERRRLDSADRAYLAVEGP